MRASPALVTWMLRKRAEYADFAASPKREDSVFVFQQNCALRRGFAGQTVVLSVVARHVFLFLVFRRAEHHFQNPLHRSVQRFLRKASVFHRFHNLFVVYTAARRHLEVEAGRNALHPVVDRAPVGNDKPIQAPFFFQNIGQQMRVFGTVISVYLIISAHDRPWLRLLHSGFKACQVQLPQRPFVNSGVNRQAVRLHVVRRVMLHRSADPFPLNAGNVCGGQARRKHRVFGVILKISAAERRALDVCRRAEQNGNALRVAFPAQRRADLPEQLRVERTGKPCPGRETGCGNALVQPEMVRPLRLFPKPVRAVRHHDGRNAEPLHRLGVPKIEARAKPGLFFQCQLRNQQSNF